MLGLDVWSRSNVSNLTAFRNASGVTFPLLLNASGSISSSYDRLVVVGPDGIVQFSRGPLSSSISAAQMVVDELLAQIAERPMAAPISDPISFGSPIVLGESRTVEITITNTGKSDLEVKELKADFATFTATLPLTVPGGESRTLKITLTPDNTETISGEIEFLTNADPFKVTVAPITVQPPPVPVLKVEDEATIDFGPVEFAQAVQKTITITNTGTATLEITDIQSDVSSLTFDTTMFTLEPNSSQTVTITFSSSTEGTFSGLIHILSNDPERATQTLSVSGIVQPPPAPAISVQQTAVDFGTIEAGQPVQKTITITNTGTASLEITGIKGDGDVSGLTFEPSMFTLSPNGSRTVTITFPSSTTGEFSGSINISSNDPDRAKHTLSVSVIVQAAPAPVLVVGEPAIDFGTIDAEKTVQKTFTIVNTGTAPLEITGIESDVSGLTFEPSMFTLEPEGSRTVTVTFPSSTEGTFSGLINILSNDPDRAKHTLSVSVIVQAAPVPVLAVQETAVNFGTVEVAQTVQQTITVKNTGTAPLEITGIESDVSGLTFEPSMFTLEPEGSQMVTVTFPSSTEGEFSGSINISSNDPDRAKHTLSVSVIVQAAPVPVLAVQETAIDFGSVEVAQTVQQTITIVNTGTAPLEITGIESDVSGLTLEPSMFTLEPNGSRMVTVTFPSSTAGEFSGSINILSNDPDRAKHTLSVSVIVQAAPVPVLVVGEPAIDFGSIDAEKTVQKTFTITNTGTAPLEITGIESDLLGLTFEPSMFTLSPDSSATITITFPKPMEGEFSGRINILSNDPDRAKHTLSITGIVQPLSVEAKSDFNRDGTIDFADFLLFVGAFGSSESQYDIDGNGAVDFPDFLMFVQVFGKKVNG